MRPHSGLRRDSMVEAYSSVDGAFFWHCRQTEHDDENREVDHGGGTVSGGGHGLGKSGTDHL